MGGMQQQQQQQQDLQSVKHRSREELKGGGGCWTWDEVRGNYAVVSSPLPASLLLYHHPRQCNMSQGGTGKRAHQVKKKRNFIQHSLE